MSRNVLDTSVLLDHWHQRRKKTRGLSEAGVRKWAQELAKVHETRAIVTPVKLEFICGATSKQEMQLSDVFLREFEIVDQGRILAEDWQEAERIARRVPRTGKRRQLGDCLVRAIANRLRHEVISHDEDFPA